MRNSLRLLHACRITLFTRANCGLCDNAKQVLSKVWDKKPFDYQEIDVMASGSLRWKDLYEFDTPVIHVEAASSRQEPLNGEARKLIHRFSEADVKKLMNEVSSSKT